MEQLHKYLRLSTKDRHLLVKSALLLWAVRLGLWLLPFQTLRCLLAGMKRRSFGPQETEQASVDRVVWAVEVASPYIPKATCLIQALATQVLLGRWGHAASLHIGVAKSAAGQLQAHAWVECQGKVVLGGTDAPLRFTPLPPLESKAGAWDRRGLFP
jgi:hypothetical protein